MAIAQNVPGRSTTCPPEALLPRNPTWEISHSRVSGLEVALRDSIKNVLEAIPDVCFQGTALRSLRPPREVPNARPWKHPERVPIGPLQIGNGPNTVLESTVSNTELTEFLTDFREEDSMSSSQSIICVPKRTHRVIHRTPRVCRRTL